jgi:hypothetical protein
VVTAQGRAIAAAEVPWLRAREVYVHAVDLATGLSFAGLRARFLSALCDDAAAKRRNGAGRSLVLEASDWSDRWDIPGDGALRREAARDHARADQPPVSQPPVSQPAQLAGLARQQRKQASVPRAGEIPDRRPPHVRLFEGKRRDVAGRA